MSDNLASPVDLRECRPGQKLLTKHGTILTYVGIRFPDSPFPHEILYPEGSNGSRTHDGYVFRNPAKRLYEDEDIVEILDY